MLQTRYRGRFAPSPTGPLHFGSLVAAVASYADARHHDGAWLVRIEDVDEARTRPGAEHAILASLQRFGLRWDEAPVRQSERKPAYRDAIRRLVDAGLAYRCNCSRRRVAETGRAGRDAAVYAGHCRRTLPPADAPAALRVKVDSSEIAFRDLVRGRIEQVLADEVGDFVVRRVDGFTAYQLAVVVDDDAQGITHIVRGADLLWSTPRQIWLQRLLGFGATRYAHVPLVLGADGRKLSKREAAGPVDEQRPLASVQAAWRFLGQAEPPAGLRDVGAFWRWAAAAWDVRRVPRRSEVQDERAGNESTDAL